MGGSRPPSVPWAVTPEAKYQGLLTDEQFFHQLKLAALPLVKSTVDEQARWNAVVAAVNASDYAAARKALALYYLKRTSIGWWGSRHVSSPTRVATYVPTENARRALGNCVLSKGVLGCLGEVDAMGRPVLDEFGLQKLNWYTSPVADLEWQWQLNRMYFSWDDLGEAYWNTLDPRYSNALKHQLRSWISFSQGRLDYDGNGEITSWDYNGHHVSVWRTIETGVRLSETWPGLFYRIRSSFNPENPADVELLVLFLKSVFQQASHLRNHVTPVGNWIVYEMTGLYAAGVIFPEFEDSAAWRDQAMAKLTEEASRQFYADGGHVELSTSYHSGAVGGYIAASNFAKFGARELEPAVANLVARMRAPLQFMAHIQAPNGYLPALNDAGNYSARSFMETACGLFAAPSNAEFCYLASGGTRGTVPALTSRFFPNSGYSVMRQSWTKDANQLIFDAGPSDGWHAHRDKLNVILYSHGRELLFDSGGGPYEDTAFRRYGISSYSHNTVVVDSLDQRRIDALDPALVAGAEPTLAGAGWVSNPQFDLAYGVYDQGYSNAAGTSQAAVQHERQVLFIKPDLFVVVDVLSPSDSAVHRYEARWHLKSTAVRAEGYAVRTADPGLSNLVIQPLYVSGLAVSTGSGLPAVSQTVPDTHSLPLSTPIDKMMGWSLDHESAKVSRATTVSHVRQGAGRQYFVTLLAPIAKDSYAQVTANPFVNAGRMGAVISAAGGSGGTLEFDAATGEIAFAGPRGSFRTAPIAPGFAVKPAAMNVFADTATSVVASGGRPPYRCSVVRGGGSITAAGTYRAPSTPGDALVQVLDANGNRRYAKLRTVNPLVMGAANLNNTGARYSELVVVPTGTYEARIVARGTSCRGGWPLMKVDVGPRSQTFEVASAAWAEYRIQVPLNYGTHAVTATFLNDCYVAGSEDRNLQIQGITLAPLSRLAPLPLFTGLTADRFRVRTVGGPCGAGCWSVWSNGYIQEAVTIPAAGEYRFQIQARGSAAGGAPAQMEIRIDGRTVAFGDVPNMAMETYDVFQFLDPGTHYVDVHFTNDYKDATADRNLYLGAASIGPGIRLR